MDLSEGVAWINVTQCLMEQQLLGVNYKRQEIWYQLKRDVL
jgi:hypothetical protein